MFIECAPCILFVDFVYECLGYFLVYFSMLYFLRGVFQSAPVRNPRVHLQVARKLAELGVDTQPDKPF